MRDVKVSAIHVERKGETIFIPLPRALWRPVDGGCACQYCSADRTPAPAFWDTLAVHATNDAPRGHIRTDMTWTVHAPELHGAKARRQ